MKRPATQTLREFVLELAAERLPTDLRDTTPGEATAALEELDELALWKLTRRFLEYVQRARRLVGGKPASQPTEPNHGRF